MTTIFDDYSDRAELLRALDDSIAELDSDDGAKRFRFANADADALRAKYELATRAAEREARKLRELQERLDASERRAAASDAELERLRENSRPNDESRDALRRYRDETAAARARTAALEAELAPLRAENERYKAAERRRAIEEQLVAEARKLDCCESALRDVRRLAPIFALNDDGVAVSEDNRLVSEVLRDEIALSPHWLNRSSGAAASSGANAPTRYDDRALFQEALRSPDADFAELVRRAPRTKQTRPF